MSRTPFLVLDGIEVVGLGSIEKPGGHSPRERVRETAAQLATDPTRLVSVGYLVEDGGGILKGGDKEKATARGEGSNRVLGWATSNDAASEVGRANSLLASSNSATAAPMPPQSQSAAAGVRAELVALEVYEETYPGDLERSLTKTARAALTGMRSRDFGAAYGAFERLANEQKKSMKRKTPPGNINESAHLAGINVHNMAVCRLLAGATQSGDNAAALADAAEELALALFLEAADLKRASFGPGHPEVAAALVEIGIRRYASDDPDGAFEALHEARRILSASLGAEHPSVAAVLNNSGCVHFRGTREGGSVAALTCFQEAKDMQQRAMETGTGAARGELDLLHVATTLCNVGYMKFRMKNYEEAGAIFEDALLVQQSVLGDNHQTIKDTLSNIALANAFHS